MEIQSAGACRCRSAAEGCGHAVSTPGVHIGRPHRAPTPAPVGACWCFEPATQCPGVWVRWAQTTIIVHMAAASILAPTPSKPRPPRRGRRERP
eukprot:185420-Chlamydomonas_euryale.AAC.1